MNATWMTDRRELAGIEAAAMQSLFALATPTERETLGLYCAKHGHGLVLASARVDSVIFNHVIGFASPDIARLDEILSVYSNREVKRAYICVDEADQAAVAALARQGFSEGRAWCKFSGLARAAGKATSTTLVVRRAGSEYGPDFGRIVASAFDMPPVVAPVLARLTQANEWSVFMSFDGPTPAGAGAMFVRDAIGYLTFGATAPGFRSRGSQAAIMQARIRHAGAMGVKRLVTETGEAVPGDPQHSWKNIERAGFQPVYRIRNFAIPAP